jgi:phage tail-like protein
VTLYLRAESARSQRLRLVLPEGVALSGYRVPEIMVGRVPYTNREGDLLEWELVDDARLWEIEVDLTILPTPLPVTLAAVAQLFGQEGETVLAEAWGTVQVEPKSRYLRFLPALYSRDDFMGRFLMLFESFWNPIDNQIGGLENYFDPMLTPPRLLGWLGSWLNVNVNGELPEARKRRLIQRAARFYRQRGTRAGLEAMLELWTDGKATIVEHRSQNLRLGKGMRLGSGVALGHRNTPFSFTVRITIPPVDGEEPLPQHQRIEALRPLIEQILDAEKPAHTTYSLEIDAPRVPGEAAGAGAVMPSGPGSYGTQ